MAEYRWENLHIAPRQYHLLNIYIELYDKSHIIHQYLPAQHARQNNFPNQKSHLLKNVAQ